MRAFACQLHGDVLQLGRSQTERGEILLDHRPVPIHHGAALSQIRG